MTISTLVKGFAGALTAAICVAAAAPSGAATLTLTNPATQSDTPMTVVFTATATELLVIDEGYQVNHLETLTNNMVTLSGGGPNLLGSTWQYRFAAVGSLSYTYSDGTPVPALGFAAQNPPYVDTFYQKFATVPGDTYTYSFDYSNNTTAHGRYAFEARGDGHFRSGSLDLGHVASRLRRSWPCRLSSPPRGGRDRVI